MPGEEFWEEVLRDARSGQPDEKKEGTYYINETHAAVYVKDREFFESQGGLTDDWGRGWRPVYAKSCEHARSMGKKMTEEEYERKLEELKKLDNENTFGNKRYGKQN